MNITNHVPLERHFTPKSKNGSDSMNNFEVPRSEKKKNWNDLDKLYRTVILAGAGAGKTHEMVIRANKLKEEKRSVFLIRIADIGEQFENAFVVGSREEFESWYNSLKEAWFFLDSVDEARLSDQRIFEKAIQQFANKIGGKLHLAHICISSRTNTWHQPFDNKLVEHYLPFKKVQREVNAPNSIQDEELKPTECELEIFQLNPLNENDIRKFAEHSKIEKIDNLIEELTRKGVMHLAERPFDLKLILSKWKTDFALDSRSGLLRDYIKSRLREENPYDKFLRPLDQDRALNGARKLAAALVLCDKHRILFQETLEDKDGIKADAVLSDWNPRDIQTLLDRAVFDDLDYGGFPHREIREYLAAEWFGKHLNEGSARHRIERIIFPENYGQRFISTRLRPLLPWLILKDDRIRHSVLELHPEIVLEGGDPARLNLSERKKILNCIIDDIFENKRSSHLQNNNAIAMIAKPDLADETLALIERHFDDDEVIYFLGKLVWQGSYQDCVLPLITIASDPNRGLYTRIVATRAVMGCSTDEQKSSFWNRLLADEGNIHINLLAELLKSSSNDQEDVARLLAAIRKLPKIERFDANWVKIELHGYIERLSINNSEDSQLLSDLIDGLKQFLHGNSGKEYQSMVYSIGTNHQFDPLRSWFSTLYETLFGTSQGPRFGSFIALFGAQKTADLITQRLKDVQSNGR